MKLSQMPASVKTGPQSAICISLFEWLCTLLGDDANQPKLVGIHALGEPPFAAGQWYFAVHPVNLGGKSLQADYVDNVMTVAITLSVKTTAVPYDRQKDGELVGDRQALDVSNYLAGEGAIHGIYDPIITRATALLGGDSSTAQGFEEPLYFQSQEWMPKGPEWWKTQGRDGPLHYGYAIETRFQGANYIRGNPQ